MFEVVAEADALPDDGSADAAEDDAEGAAADAADADGGGGALTGCAFAAGS